MFSTILATFFFHKHLLLKKNPVCRLERHKSPNEKHWNFKGENATSGNSNLPDRKWVGLNHRPHFCCALFQLSYIFYILIVDEVEKGRFELPCTSHVQRHILTHYDVLSSASAFLLYRVHHRQ